MRGYCARTCTIQNSNQPAWDARHSPRAFKLPLTCPYSIVYIALKDDDVGADDDIGRVVLELGGLRSETVFDFWFPLQYGSIRRLIGKRGAVRLRFSVSFYDERKRILEYARFSPGFSIPFVDGAAKRAAAFAYRGKNKPRKFRWRIFDSHLKEIILTLKVRGRAWHTCA